MSKIAILEQMNGMGQDGTISEISWMIFFRKSISITV